MRFTFIRSVSGLLFLGMMFFFTSCENQQHPYSKTIGFYFWRTNFEISSNEEQYMNQVNASKLYIRLFDLDTVVRVDGTIDIIPVSIVQKNAECPINYKIIPVVYMTRNAMRHVKSIATLAKQIATLVNELTKSYHWSFDEIQWDMDWTPSTKNTYFDLLRQLKQEATLSNKHFSATIRLHQIKHIKLTGVPPVERGLLMCYNMGNLKKYGNVNSILDQQVVDEYLSNYHDYPLPLDLGLPLFSWALHFRDKQFQGIISRVTSQELLRWPMFIQQSNGLYTITQDVLFHDQYFQVGDEMRVEEVSEKNLLYLAQVLKKTIQPADRSIIFYHIHDSLIKNYKYENIQAIVEAL